MTRCSNDVVVVEEPVYVDRPVVIYEEPQVIYEKRVVYEPTPVCTRSCPTQAELAWRDQQVRRAEFKQLKHDRKKRDAEWKKYQQSRNVAQKNETVKIVETRTVGSNADTKGRELVLKEKQMELDLMNKRTEMLREENKKKELAIKELELKRSKASFKKDKENIQEEIITKTVTRSATA